MDAVATIGQRFTLASADGSALTVTVFAAPGPAHSACVIAPATGVPQGLYRALAAWLAERGTVVYTFDWRGSAASRPARLRGFKAGFEHWTRDADTVVQHALARHAHVSFIGHSIGGFLAPLMAHAPHLHRLVMVGAQTAYWRDWPQPQRWPMLLLWHGLMPAITAVAGYFPGRALRMGEDLPRGVALQWAARPWRDPFEHGDGNQARALYARSLPPVHMAAASDDPFATPPAQERVAVRLTGCTVARHTWQPEVVGLRSLGHFGIFRSRAAALWPQLWGWAQGIDMGSHQRSTA